MSVIEVLKFGSSVLRSPEDLPVAVDEIYRHWRAGCRVLAVVSAFEGVTNRLFKEADSLFPAGSSHATAAFVAIGEQRTATLLVSALTRCGIVSRVVEPQEIGLLAEGSGLESAPLRVDTAALERFWAVSPILVLPGFYGVDAAGRTVLFGRGGSDMSALFLATELGARCQLLKDGCGVFDEDPARSTRAHRFTMLSWTTALKVAGPLIQAKALRYAHTRALPFHVGRPNECARTLVGHTRDEWAPPSSGRPVRVALLGCGVVGRGVYDLLKRYPQTFTVRLVVVGDRAKYQGIAEATTDSDVALEAEIDLVVECFGGIGQPYPLISAALAGGKRVVTANKAVVAAHWPDLRAYVRGKRRQLWYSAAVGGVLPVLETCERLGCTSSVREIRGTLNGTCGVVLDAQAQGKTRDQAIALAQAGGFAEANPERDLSGEDAADKLALLIEAAFGGWLAPASIATRGLDSIQGDGKGYKLIARARCEGKGDAIVASVAPERVPMMSFLGQSRSAENRIEIELEGGEVITLCGQGAGRWPTAVAMMGDLHEVARLLEEGRESGKSEMGVGAMGSGEKRIDRKWRKS